MNVCIEILKRLRKHKMYVKRDSWCSKAPLKWPLSESLALQVLSNDTNKNSVQKH